ncbi:hypothetical protein ACFOEQ_06605 [Chryseobacterium arachidis]
MASILIGTMVVVMPLLLLMGKWWFKVFYGKYILQIENLVKELRK